MSEVFEWIKAFFTNADNINEIALWGVTGLLALIGGLIWLFMKKGIGKLKGKKGLSVSEKAYKKTIKQIERKKIPMPDGFLFGKSPERNPELKKIYQMMDDGRIEKPESYKIQQFLKNNPNGTNLNLKLNNPPIRPPKPPRPPSL